MKRYLFLFALLFPLSSCSKQQYPEEIKLPPGFVINIYASHVPNARQMALGDKGVVFVGT